MKVLVFSDSHSYNAGMFWAVEREAPDAVLHLGDHTDDARELERAWPQLPVYRVRGNNDYQPDTPLYACVRLSGVPVYITHGHRDRVSMLGCGIVPQRAREEGCGLAFFGHTHRMMLERIGGVLVCNPGSISLPRDGRAGFARLTIEDGQARLLALLGEDGALLRQERIG